MGDYAVPAYIILQYCIVKHSFVITNELNISDRTKWLVVI